MDNCDFKSCRRDQFHLFILFHNMALCYQKMSLLEECAQCIEYAFENLPLSSINLEEKSISYRMKKIFIIGKLKLQYCAILSQINRHKDAMKEAREGTKIGHQLIEDMYELCHFQVQREKIDNAYNDQIIYTANIGNKRESNFFKSRNTSLSSYLTQKEAYLGYGSFNSSIKAF